ncbi:lipid II flippase MurJ [Pedobacter aquatilis]|uniref:lipid II flippase MurJ n=1 Tax=Pedobacter aquatilis TaxID=351343 RepID=UPI00292F73DC|nr:lipid II flippase MurJ [Pedobacter aquatilis]
MSLSLTAKYFGVSIDKDVWLLSLSAVLFLDMAVWGPINETFRSKFIFLRGEVGEELALQKTRSLLFFSFIISIGLVCLILIFPEFLAKIIAPTYSGEKYHKLINMIVTAAPILLITQMSAIYVSILNAYESFFIPEITGFATSILNLILLILLAPKIGIYSIVISYYIGSILLLILLFIQIRRMKIPIWVGYNVKFADFKIFFMFALPFFLPYSFGQISGVLEKTLVSTIGIGNVSALDYSRKFTDIFVSVLTSVLVTMLIPVLSSKFVESKPREFSANFMQIFQLGILLLSIIIPIFTSASPFIVDIFFNKGKISSDTLTEISKLTMLYSWSTFPVFVYLIFGMALLASGRGKKYAFYGMLAQIFSIFINLAFVKVVGIFIFPISLLISHMISGMIMAYKFPFKNRAIVKLFFKYIIILILNTVAVYFCSKIIQFGNGQFLQIVINSAITFILLLSFIYLLNLEEKNTINLYSSKLISKWKNF